MRKFPGASGGQKWRAKSKQKSRLLQSGSRVHFVSVDMCAIGLGEFRPLVWDPIDGPANDLSPKDDCVACFGLLPFF